jgi:hypothetical protein
MQAEDIIDRWAADVDPARIAAFRGNLAKGRAKTSSRAVSRYSEVGRDGDPRVISDPPFVVPVSDLAGTDEADVRGLIETILAQYRQTVPDHLKVLLDRYRVVNAARKVVGVGSVGTRCFIVLMVGKQDPTDDLVLQLKQAGPSVLAGFAPASAYDQHGRRVVEGQRLMQASSDMLLGWTTITGFDRVARGHYLPQLWDWKTSPDLDTMSISWMQVYARICGWTLARAHARSGNRYAIAAYLGSGRAFTRAMQDFAES